MRFLHAATAAYNVHTHTLHRTLPVRLYLLPAAAPVRFLYPLLAAAGSLPLHYARFGRDHLYYLPHYTFADDALRAVLPTQLLPACNIFCYYVHCCRTTAARNSYYRLPTRHCVLVPTPACATAPSRRATHYCRFTRLTARCMPSSGVSFLDCTHCADGLRACLPACTLYLPTIHGLPLYLYTCLPFTRLDYSWFFALPLHATCHPWFGCLPGSHLPSPRWLVGSPSLQVLVDSGSTTCACLPRHLPYTPLPTTYLPTTTLPHVPFCSGCSRT